MAYTSLFELFKIGIGPSSSHTVGPMLASRMFAESLSEPTSITVELHGSLALTGFGHGTNRALVLGLRGERPETVDLELAGRAVEDLERRGGLTVADGPFVPFTLTEHVTRVERIHSAHANVMHFVAAEADGSVAERWYASLGGGFVTELVDQALPPPPPGPEVPWPYETAAELLEMCERSRSSMATIILQNEEAIRSPNEIREDVGAIVATMYDSIERGMRTEGTLPGLGVRRRARDLSLELTEHPTTHSLPPTGPSDWAGIYATAVNEENAAGGRIVTAPTNGAAGIIPGVMKFMDEFCETRVEDPELEFLLTATAIGSLIKEHAGISGAELGCQGEVGTACAMAAAGLTAALGGSPAQAENAAEIAVEHNLGLTCDPVGGYVQIPCIERNAVGAVKAITAASLALRGDGTHMVSLDVVIETMRQTGADMDSKYKETSLGGLAVNVPAC